MPKLLKFEKKLFRDGMLNSKKYDLPSVMSKLSLDHLLVAIALFLIGMLWTFDILQSSLKQLFFY